MSEENWNLTTKQQFKLNARTVDLDSVKKSNEKRKISNTNRNSTIQKFEIKVHLHPNSIKSHFSNSKKLKSLLFCLILVPVCLYIDSNVWFAR